MIALFLTAVLTAPQGDEVSSRVQTFLTEAREQLAKGDAKAATLAIEKALERDWRNLEAIRLFGKATEALGDTDRAVHTYHRWIDLYDAQSKPPYPKKVRKEVFDHLLVLDPEAKAWSKLQGGYTRSLAALGKDYQKKKDWLGALGVFVHLLQVDPNDRTGKAGIKNVRRNGGKEVAVDDVFAGAGDPSEGKSKAQIEKEDLAHADWDNAYRGKTENYKYRTNAGFLVLQTSMIAMEQMNKFYRKFFHYKEDGGRTPMIEIRVFKSRDEYLSLGQSPAEWSGGHFIGSAVETYVGGVTGKDSIRSMYRTLFHEAAHQFVSLNGPLVPGWLNEAFASFFEGTTILSNGSVRWNQPPPGRLFPLCRRMEHGWMKSHDEAAAGAGGKWTTPQSAPDFRMVVLGNYRWGPPWYAPTWGVVYFLYNYRTEEGLPIYREQLHEYFRSFKGGRPKDAIGHFEELVLQGSKLSKVKSIDELTPIWKLWILDLRDKETGAKESGAELLRYAEAALQRGDKAMALEFYDEARLVMSSDPEMLWKMATLLESMKKKSRAAAVYREFLRELELNEKTDDERYPRAKTKIQRLDPYVRRYHLIKTQLAYKGIALAKGYEARKLPTMALEIARRMSASFSIPAALDYYIDLATRTGVSLARWRVAYNERDLDGWSGDDEAYQAYGATIRTDVRDKLDEATAGNMVTRQLTCDVTFDGDFSLSAEMQIEADGDQWKGRMMGLCFGRKGDQNFHAVLLHPKGFMDTATNRGGTWTILDHRQVKVGDEWHTLRIDVTGKTLDVFYDGLFVRSLEFKSSAAVRGGFGLITGIGTAKYRNIRLLARDPHDPAGLVERQIAMAKVAMDSSLRQAGTFTGIAPPAVRADWVQGTGVDLAAAKGKPVMLVFWSPRQDQVIPCTAYFRHLMARGKAAGLVTVVVCDGGTGVGELQTYLGDHPLPGAHIGIDHRGSTYEPFYVKQGFFGMPRVLLIDRAGKVVFEGDPGLAKGVGWKAGDAQTYIDGPFDALLGR